MSDSELATVATTHPIPAPTRDIVVLARTPEEMAVSQQGLIGWAGQKLAAERAQLAETEENLAEAQKGKYRTNRWSRQVSLARSRVTYYEKVLAALEEGYYIVPAFAGIDTVVIRTKRESPAPNIKESNWGPPTLPEFKAETLPLGAGHYVSPTPEVSHWTGTRRDETGKQTEVHFASARAFGEIDFPFHVVRPQILRDFNHALELRIFDEIGVLPARRRRGDPMVVGTVKRREGYTEHTVNFLISWWIDTRDL